jgi:hypothetical protein
MSRTLRLGRAALGALACLGCATKSLPPGTPPPDYEKRTFDPWPPPDAGPGAEAPDAAPEAPLPDAASDAAPAPDAAVAPETGLY